MNSKTKLKLKPIIDILMTFALLLLMSYELLGSTAHEVVGVAMFVLFVVHHALNINWAKHLAKGRQTPIRIFQNILVLLVLISFVGSIVSGVIVSRHLFVFLNIKSTYAANRIHMLSAYWGFVFMSLHLGLHFNMILLMIKKATLTKNENCFQNNIHTHFCIRNLRIFQTGYSILPVPEKSVFPPWR